LQEERKEEYLNELLEEKLLLAEKEDDVDDQIAIGKENLGEENLKEERKED